MWSGVMLKYVLISGEHLLWPFGYSVSIEADGGFSCTGSHPMRDNRTGIDQMCAAIERYDRIVNPDFPIRRFILLANNVIDEASAGKDRNTFEQRDIFTDYAAQEAKQKTEQVELERENENPIPKEDRATELVQRFLASVSTNREFLFSLIERVELSEDKQIYIKFRFK